MSNDYVYILYNSTYGGFSMRREFLIELFKIYPAHTEIGKKIFTMEKINNQEIFKKENLETEYFIHYMITDKYIIDTHNNEYYYISELCSDLRANQELIQYIFERTYLKIINNDEFTPYFYNALFQFDKIKFTKEITEEEANTRLIELTQLSQDEIYDFTPENIVNRRRRRHIIKNDNNRLPKNIIFYKNGFKQNDSYYEFTFDINITKNNIYDILSEINDCILLDYILFDDINGSCASLSIEKINKSYEWKISEYDGSETVRLSLPYKNIIEDLLNHIWKTESYENKTNFASQLIDKSKTIQDLLKNIYQ